jgi:hypothetical protein
MNVTKAVRIPEHILLAINEPLSPLVARLTKQFIASGASFPRKDATPPKRTSIYMDHTLIEAIRDKAAESDLSFEAAIVHLLNTHLDQR